MLLFCNEKNRNILNLIKYTKRVAKMYLKHYLNEKGERVYTLKVKLSDTCVP